jgi:hypothetical protein
VLLCISVNIKENKKNNDSLTNITIDPEFDKYLPFKNKN